MGPLEFAKSLVHTYLRMVGLVLLIAYAVVQRLWEQAKPSLTPIINIYDTIDPDNVTVVTLVQQFVRAVLMAGSLYWKLLMTLWEAVSKPFRPQIEAVYKFMDGVNNDHNEVYKKLGYQNHKKD